MNHIKQSLKETFHSDAYQSRRSHSAALLFAAGVPTITAVIALLYRQEVSLLRILLSILCAGCFVILCMTELRELRVSREAAQLLVRACQQQPDLTLQEEFNAMNLSQQVNFVFSSLMDSMQNEYESTLLAKQAELFALQAQINPHFLYNTLDSIRGQAVVEGADEIADTIEALSNLFKYSIGKGENLVPLRQEIDNLTYYMKIQKYRYIDKIDLKMQIDGNEYDTLRTRVPKLILQPIIENAIYHGLEPKLEKGTVQLRVTTEQERLKVIIADNGVGMDEETLLCLKRRLCGLEPSAAVSGTRGHGIALDNVNQRIQQYFGPSYGLQVYSTHLLGTRVEITVPYRREYYDGKSGDSSVQ